jgi:hypothetical protein
MAGCSSINNVTARRQVRNDTDQYLLEVQFKSTRQTMRWDSIKPNVVIGKDFYPMHLTPLMTNRWETLVPIPRGESVLYYQYKFDYDCNSFGPKQPGSLMSHKYRLQILEK